jgi:hypothetical protein
MENLEGLEMLGTLDAKGKMDVLAALASFDEVEDLDENGQRAALAELVPWAFSEDREMGDRNYDKKWPGFLAIEEEFVLGHIDEFRAAIELRKIGAFGAAFGGEIDSWGGVLPRGSSGGLMFRLLGAMEG